MNSSDAKYLVGFVVVAGLFVFIYRQHQKGVVEKLKQQELGGGGGTPAANSNTNAVDSIQPETQIAYPAPILINAPASMFKVPVDRNNAVILPVNIPAGYSPQVI